MERLTERLRDGQVIPRTDLRSNGHNKCMNLLAAYEDTGLTPEQVSQLQIDYAAKGTLLAEYQNTGLTPPEIPSIVYHTDEDRFKTDCCGEDVTNTDYNFCPNCGKRLGEVVEK